METGPRVVNKLWYIHAMKYYLAIKTTDIRNNTD